MVDNKNLKVLNLNWFRGQLGVVNQEPILFGTTIKENIKFGKENASDEEIITAAKSANAHDFIMSLPQVGLCSAGIRIYQMLLLDYVNRKKYETLVGDRGGQLSGGQKQRA